MYLNAFFTADQTLPNYILIETIPLHGTTCIYTMAEVLYTWAKPYTKTTKLGVKSQLSIVEQFNLLSILLIT